MHDELYFVIKSMREPVERLRSISACFDYSYERLSPNLKKKLLQLTMFKSHFIAGSVKEIFGTEESVLTDYYERTFLQRSPIQSKGGSEEFVYDFHPVIWKYLIGKYPKNFSFTPYEQIRYVRHYSNFVRTIYKRFFQDISKHSRLIDLLTYSNINDLSEAIAGIGDKNVKSVISNLLGLLLLQTGHKSRARFYHELCYEIDRHGEDRDRIAN